MVLMHEGRLDNAVSAGSLGIHEKVEVKTMMGEHVVTGEVIASVPLGVGLRDPESKSFLGWFRSDLYLFSPVTEEPVIETGNVIDESPDGRAMAKLVAMGEVDLVSEMKQMADSDSKKKDVAVEPVADPNASVDVDTLPDDIKMSIISSSDMDEATMNSVMSEVGDSVVRALKRASVRDNEIYGIAAKIQNAVYKVLSGKEPKKDSK